jgi:hypothetical protein
MQCEQPTLHLKLNCHTHSSPLMRGKLPSASVNVRPSCISFSISTFSLRTGEYWCEHKSQRAGDKQSEVDHCHLSV